MNSTDLMQFFGYSHLPLPLARISEKFCALAMVVDDTLPENGEKVMALRKLLEAKDCAVRSVLMK